MNDCVTVQSMPERDAAARAFLRLEEEILPELITDAAHQMAWADLARCRDLLRTEIIR